MQQMLAVFNVTLLAGGCRNVLNKSAPFISLLLVIKGYLEAYPRRTLYYLHRKTGAAKPLRK